MPAVLQYVLFQVTFVTSDCATQDWPVWAPDEAEVRRLHAWYFGEEDTIWMSIVEV